MPSYRTDLEERARLLEAQLQERTAELLRANAQLNEESLKRQQAEAAWRASEERYRALYQDNPSMFFTLNPQGTIISVNSFGANQLGYTIAELEGQPVLKVFYPDDQAEVVRQFQECIQHAGQMYHWEFRKVRKDGSLLWVEEFAHAVRDPNGLLQVLIMCQDITHRKQAEAEIRTLNIELEERVAERTRELEAFSYSVSHDLHAPLRAIEGFSRIVVEDYALSLDPQVRQYLHQVRERAQRMKQLIDDLLDFSRLNRRPLTKQPVRMTTLVQEALEELHPDYDQRRVEIRLGELPPCQADPVLLKQVLLNLLGNALKYTGKREVTYIEIGAHETDEEVVYFVKDNGSGFDMRYADKLFGVFQRLHSGKEFEGTGVGLAIVERILQRHGGRVWAEAEVDKGAIFYFSLSQT